MAGYQRWVTFASDDSDVWKCVLLGRSLRKTLTTRQLQVIISPWVTDNMWVVLKNEFDNCHRILMNEVERYPNQNFAAIAKIVAWEGKGKFVFLDCNCIVLKNSDKLFRQADCIQFFENENKTLTTGLAAVLSSKRCEADLVIRHENGDLDANLMRALKITDYCTAINLKSSEVMFGKGMKMIYFTHGHPVRHFFEKQQQNLENGTLERTLLKMCEILCPELSLETKLWTVPKQSCQENIQQMSMEISNSIAIIGMACRFPGANTLEEFWTMLEHGHEGICKVPDGRWTKQNSFIRLDGVRNTEAGFLACSTDRFDGKFFNTNAADLNFVDPQQRLALKVVWEGFEHAGIDPSALKNSQTGVFGGWWRQDYKEMLQEARMNEAEFFRAYMGNALGTFTARISHFFELTGPSISTESGCSTSIVGVDMACDSLRNENCDIAVAVGANLLLHPFSINFMNGVISMDGRCKTFDAEADGFGRAEGVGVLILKRYPDAVANGDTIWGLIRGSAVVQEGPSKMMGSPTVECEALAMELALQRAGVEANEVSYVETHGTGTPVGDPLEIAAVTKAYSKNRTDILTIGSVKTNIGHTESVSGIAGIIKTLLAMQNELIPPHLNVKSLNPDINLSAIPAQLPLSSIPWKKCPNGKPRIAGVSSFGITGTDAHVIIQEAPVHEPDLFQLYETRPVKLITCSGKTEQAAKIQVKVFADFLAKQGSSLEDVEYTMHTGRSHFPFRCTFLGTSFEDFKHEMCQKPLQLKSIPSTTPKLCFLFTGQGSQYQGMAKSLYEGSIIFRTHFDYCNTILCNEYGFSIKESLWSSNHKEQLLSQTLYSQTSIFVVEYCLFKLWESWGILPETVVGHSLGEFGAAVAAGILTLESALKLVVRRSQLIQELPNASMLVVRADAQTVTTLLKRAFEEEKISSVLEIAAVNTPEQTVIAGHTEHVNLCMTYCENNHIKTHILSASHAFHSQLMDPILQEYEAVASGIKYSEPSKCTFVSGMDGNIVKKVDAKYWVRHTREKVKFMDASQTLLKNGNTLFLEVGPHPVLSAMIMINSEEESELNETISCHASLQRNKNDWNTILSSLGKLYTAGVPINWENFQQFSKAKKVDVPGYCFEENSSWITIKNDGTMPFHPLLGGCLPNPSDLKIYKNDVSINRVPFLIDHALSDKIIFPGAGYLEMCLTAGYAEASCSEGVFIKPTAPMSLQHFSIDSPICLDENSPTEFQVVVTKSPESGSTLTSIYTKLFLDDSNFKWVKHACATFYPTNTIVCNTNESWTEILEKCSVPLNSEFDYDTLESYGFKFGPSFRNLKKAWGTKQAASNEMLFEFETKASMEDYLLHPCIIDAMFQAQIISIGKLFNKQTSSKMLVVPVQVGSLTWLHALNTKTGYIHVKSTSSSSDNSEISLFDKGGLLISKMTGVEFVETTLHNIMSLIESQRNPFPSMLEPYWREEMGPAEKRILDDRRGDICLKQYSDPDKILNTFEPLKQEFYEASNTLYGLYMLKALVMLEIQDHLLPNNTIRWPDICEKLHVLPELNLFMRYILCEVAKDGWLKISNESLEILDLQCIKPFPSCTTLLSQIERLENDIIQSGIGIIDVNCVTPFCSNLSKILTGNHSALSLLFPTTTDRGPAELYYKDSLFASTCVASLQNVLHSFAKTICSLPSKNSNSNSAIKFLEVGGGTGSASQAVIQSILDTGKASSFEYTFTDLSPAFLPKGAELFKDTGIAALFQQLDIEEDPTEQGFIPGHYDIVCASFVIHATRSIEESLNNIKKLMKPSGYIFVQELSNSNRAINLMFGGLKQFWNFSDKTLRPYNCSISSQKWKETLEKCGFEEIVQVDYYNSEGTLIMGKLKPQQYIRGENVVRNPDSTDFATDELLLWLVFGDDEPGTAQVTSLFNNLGRHYKLITPDDVGLFNETSTNLEANIYSIFAEVKNKRVKLQGIIYLWGLNYFNQKICELYLYICKYLYHWEDSLKLLVFTKGVSYIGTEDSTLNPPHTSVLVAMTSCLCNENSLISVKCVDVDPSSNSNSDFFEEAVSEIFLKDDENNVVFRNNRRLLLRQRPYKPQNTALPIPKSKRYRLILPTSNMISDLKFGTFEQKPILDDEIEVEIKAYSLNFRDLMAVLKPDPVFDTLNTVGFDYAGVVSAVGKNSSWKIGDRVFGGATNGDAMPSYVITNEKNVAQLPKKMTFCDGATLPAAFLTVHMCLIDLAKIKEGDIVLIHTATGGVGLCAVYAAMHRNCTIVATAGSARKRNFLRGMGIQHIFNSRTTAYEHEIPAALGGPKVNVVLNSLTQSGFKEATLSVCAPGARFIEMSKMNIWSKEEMKSQRPDVMYEIVDLTNKTAQELSQELQDQLLENENKLLPLPYTRFSCTEIRAALEYMKSAKHIGKIVVTFPEPLEMKDVNLFNDNSTYMITGGLGGIGMEVAKWMSTTGAKTLLLVGRNAPKPEALAQIEKIKSRGVEVIVRQCDIGNFEKCKELVAFAEENSLPPLRGIMHAAGVLSDQTYDKQTWENYEMVFNSKVYGSWNLHQLTANLRFPLEHFVMFSSMAADFGPIGQSNHAAANHFLDALANYRNSIGLTGTTVNWGQWGQVGVAANMTIPALKQFTVFQGIAALEHIMKSHKNKMVVYQGDLAVFKQVFPSTKTMLSEIEISSDSSASLDSDEFWKAFDCAQTPEEKFDVLRAAIKGVLRIQLKLGKEEEINDHASFQDLGMDSLMMVEMKNGLSMSIGKRIKLSINSIKDCTTVHLLAQRLLELVSGKVELPPPSLEETKQLILNDCVLPEEISISETVVCQLQNISTISTVFITGVTGTLGPYVLREVLKRPNIKKVFCLMRENKIISPRDRLKYLLMEKKLLPEIDLDKIEYVVGDIAEPEFGMKIEEYFSLCEKVNAVFNLAVKSDWGGYYRDTNSLDNARVVNVTGLKNVLRFSIERKVKYVFHASTIMAETQVDEGGQFWEDWPVEGEFDNLPNSAYVISKFVCEHLVAEAVARGIPCKLFRFTNFGGDTVLEGNFQITNSALMMRMLAYLYLGFMPARNVPLCIMPVNLSAKLSVQLFFNDSTGCEVFNVANPYLGDERDFDDIAEEFGVTVEVLEPDMFLEKVEKFDKNDEVIQIVKMVTSREKDYQDNLEYIPAPFIKWLEGNKNVMMSKKLAKYLPNEYPPAIGSSIEVLKRDLQYTQSIGIFDRFGIKCLDTHRIVTRE